jgi:glycosyltransferase involved in cell wall biosynthesis
MHHGRPVVVCSDGGGLAELVDDGETGLVVEPTPAAIAAAVTRLHADDDLASRLGRNGRERAAQLTWSRAAGQLLTAVEATLDAAA